MKSFSVELQAARVVFGSGCLSQLPIEVERLQAGRVLLVTTPGRSRLAARAAELLGAGSVATFSGAAVHVPEEVAVAARAAATESGADCIVALGGGSAIGAAKAIALDQPIPIVAIPTTYAGSEMTPIWGRTLDGRKETGRNPRVQPRVVIYDPELTLDLPPRVSAASGMNAMAHCVEALYAGDANPLTTKVALDGLAMLARALPAVIESPGDVEQRAAALEGAWLAGFALGTVQMALHHKLCHVLGALELPHAETHAVLLPYTAAFNRDAAADAMRMAAGALGVEDAPTELLQLAQTVGTPASLAEIGMSAGDIDRAADLAVERPYPNPQPVTREAVRRLLEAAFAGEVSYITPG